MGLEIIGTTDITGVAIDGDFGNPMLFIIIGAAVAVLSVLGSILSRFFPATRGFFRTVFVLGLIASVGILAYVLYLVYSNTNEYDENMAAVKSHYSIDVIELKEFDEIAPAGFGGAFSEDKLHPADIEYQGDVIGGYLSQVEEDRWAVVIDDSAGAGERFIEFDDFIQQQRYGRAEGDNQNAPSA